MASLHHTRHLRIFWHLILVTAFNRLLRGKVFHQQKLNSYSIISMLPKPNTDEMFWENYRPISLLNLNIKLLAKMFMTRLSPILCSLIHKDQIVFTPPLPCLRKPQYLSGHPNHRDATEVMCPRILTVIGHQKGLKFHLVA